MTRPNLSLPATVTTAAGSSIPNPDPEDNVKLKTLIYRTLSGRAARRLFR